MKINLIDILPEIRGQYRQNAALKTWFDVGGNAQILFRPKDSEDLSCFLKNRPKNMEINVLGAGSNVIVADNGVKGVVIRLGGSFAEIKYENDDLWVGGATLCANLIQFCKNEALSGIEFLSGIPGSVGGAVAMNAGCYGDDISKVLKCVKVVDYEGNISVINVSDIAFSYRKNNLRGDFIFLEACFNVRKATTEQISCKVEELCAARQLSQPIRAKTGGSTFKNPFPSDLTKKKAWQLIDEVGLRGKKNGGAKISEKHCNFLINEGEACAQDLIELGNLVRKRVKDEFDQNLEWEISIMGEAE